MGMMGPPGLEPRTKGKRRMTIIQPLADTDGSLSR